MLTEIKQKPVYQSYAHACAEIHDIAPIDYFFAKEFTQDLLNVTTYSSQVDNEPTSLLLHHNLVLFHLLLALSYSARQGHSCIPLTELANHHFGYKSDETGVITHHGYVFPPLKELVELVENLNIKPDHNKGVVGTYNCLYMRRNYLFEQELQSQLQVRSAMRIAYSQPAITNVLQQLFLPADSTNDALDWQAVAVANALNKNISVIAGGPGTGKTYTVTKLLAAILMLNPAARISLVAPTGKAAQRLTESIIKAVTGFAGQIAQPILDAIPTEAKTLHRYLGVIPHQLQFKHNQHHQVASDVLILDEVSMVDLALMTRLFRALPEQTQVIMLGDADQLPSVALGSVLADIAPRPHPGYSPENLDYLSTLQDSKKITAFFNAINKSNKKGTNDGCYADHLSYLYKSRRFDGEGGIGLMAKAVIESDAERGWQLLIHANDNGQTDIAYAPELDAILPILVKQYYRPLLTEKNIAQAFKQLSQFRILAASRKGAQGVEQLNEQVVHLLGKTLSSHTQLFHGMPIMVNENSYGLGLYNGDIGVVWQSEQGHLVVAFECPEQGYRYIMPTRLPSFEPVYAMTIHKTQGSEFDHVYMVLANQQDNKLLSRELLYTGITRAKKQLTISALHRVWFSAVETNVKRFSNLSLPNSLQP